MNNKVGGEKNPNKAVWISDPVIFSAISGYQQRTLKCAGTVVTFQVSNDILDLLIKIVRDSSLRKQY